MLTGYYKKKKASDKRLMKCMKVFLKKKKNKCQCACEQYRNLPEDENKG